MPGGYGTDESLPWGPHGDTGYQAPTPSGGGQQGGPGHPGGYDPNRNRPQVTTPKVTAPPVKTGIVDTNVFTAGSSDDPYGEKGDYIDYDYVNPNTGLTVGQSMADRTHAALEGMNQKSAQVQQSQFLANALKSGDINKEQLQGYMESGILPGHIAEKGGLAEFSGYDTHGNPIYVDPTTGKPYDPRGKFTAGMSEDLSDLQFMQSEGVYGGVSGLEAEVNKQKGSIVSELGKMKTQGLNSNQIKERLKQDPNFASLAKLHGYEGSMDDIFNPTDTVAGSVGDWIMANTTQPDPGAKGLGAVGYDPTGVHTWNEIQDNPELYEKYLNRGTLWDDPLSGILKAPGEPPQRGQGEYNRYRNRYGRGAYDRKMALLQALAGGSPMRKQEKSGFMESMVDPYAEETRIAGEKGIFSGLFGKAGQTGVSGEGMKRLLKSWGSGYTNPLHANVAARGGIMSAWNDMRR
jgi:hypothetical protein